MQEIAGNLSSLLQAANAAPKASAEARERLARTMAHIGPVAAAVLPPPIIKTAEGSADEKPSEEEAGPASVAPLDGGKLQPSPDRHLLSRCANAPGHHLNFFLLMHKGWPYAQEYNSSQHKHAVMSCDHAMLG